jgi:hypothetical protein
MSDTPLSAYRRLLNEDEQRKPAPGQGVRITKLKLDPKTLGTADNLRPELRPSEAFKLRENPDVTPSRPAPITPLQVLNVGGQAAGRAAGSLWDKPGNVVDAAFEGLKGVQDAFTPGAQMTSISQEVEKRTGQKMPTLANLAVDIASDPTNIIAPEKVLAMGLPAAAMMGGLKRVDDVAKVGGKLVDDFGRVTDDAVDLTLPKRFEKVEGLGDVTRMVEEGGDFGVTPLPKKQAPSIDRLDADDVRVHAFADRHSGLDKTVQKELKDILFEGDNFWQQRRMGQTFEETQRLADEILPHTNLPKGTAANAEESLALRGAAVGLLDQAKTIGEELFNLPKLPPDQVSALMQKYNARSVQELTAIREEAWLKAKGAIASMMGVRSEAGRALNSYKQIRAAREMGDMDFVTKALEKGALPDQVFEKLGQLSTKEEQYKYLRSLTKPGAQELWKWYFISNLLSGVKTHARNLIGNSTRIGAEMLGDFSAAAVGTVTRNPGRISFGEAAAQLPATISGISDGFKKAVFSFKNGYTLDMAHEFTETAPEVFGGKLLPNIVGRTLNAEDEFFRTIGYTTELHRLAYRAARKEGLVGDALHTRFAEILDDPSVDMIKAAKTHGAEMVFRQPPGKGTRKLRELMNTLDEAGAAMGNGLNAVGDRMTQSDFKAIRAVGKTIETGSFLGGVAKLPIGTFLMPFITTPANILRAGTHFSPAGLAVGAFKGDQKAIGRGAVGTALLGWAAMKAAEGEMTGAAPTDAAERDKFYADGKKPNAIKIGDQWISYQTLAPLSFPLSVVANAVDTVRRARLDGPASANLAGEVLAKTANSVLDQSYLSGMMGLVSAITDYERRGDAFVGRTLTGFIPGSGLLRNVRDVVDDAVRAPEGISENIQASIPGLSSNIEPRLDMAGRTVRKSGNALVRGINPVEVSASKPDPVRQMMVDADTYYTNPQIKNLGLTRQQETIFKKTLGAALEQQLSALAQDQSFMSLPAEERRREIESIKRDIGNQVRDYFKAKYGGKGK